VLPTVLPLGVPAVLSIISVAVCASGVVVVSGAQVMAETPIVFACTCSHERAMATLQALGVDEVQDIVDTMGSTAVTCQFCGTRHEITLPNLWTLLERLGRPQRPN